VKPGKLSEVAALLLSPWEREDSMLRVAKMPLEEDGPFLSSKCPCKGGWVHMSSLSVNAEQLAQDWR